MHRDHVIVRSETARTAMAPTGASATVRPDLRVLCMAGLLLLTNAILPVLEGRYEATPGSDEGSLAFRVLSAGVYAVVGLALWRQRSKAWRIARRVPLLPTIVAFAFASTLWSVDPGLTFQRSVALCGTTLLGVYLALTFSVRQVLAMVVTVTVIGGVASVLVGTVRPDVAIHRDEHSGSWRGAYSHKNEFGRMATVGLAATLALSIRQGRIGMVSAGSALFLATMIGLSRSAAAAAIATLLLSLGMILHCSHRYRIDRSARVILAVLAAATAGGAATLFFPTLVESLGRDATLTGRIPLWLELLDKLHRDSPWVGFGYGAFWTNDAAWSIRMVAVSWMPNHAHNGAVGTLIDLGYLGLLLFVALLASAFAGAFRLSLADGRRSWMLIILALLALMDVAHHSVLQHNSIFWVLLSHAYVVSRLSRQPVAFSRVKAATRQMRTRDGATAAGFDTWADGAQSPCQLPGR